MTQKFESAHDWAPAAFAALMAVASYPVGTELTQDNIDALNEIIEAAPNEVGMVGALALLGLNAGIDTNQLANMLGELTDKVVK